jgi:hypothetical protein
MCDHYPVAQVTHGDWGDEYPAIRLVGDSSFDRKAEAYMEMINYGTVSDATARANWHLISAAPELLAALQLVVDTYGFDSSTDSSIWRTALAAIAKATGVAP